MGKALKTVGAVIGAAALVATGAGAILMPGMAGTTTLFGVSVGTLNTVSAGLMAVGGMLDKPESMGSGTPDEWNSNPDQPTPFAFGRVGCSGKIVHRDEYGKDNKLQGVVSVYSGAGPIKSFVSYKVNDLPVSFTSNGGTAIGKYNRQMWRSWRLGEQPDTALSLPTGLDEGAVMPAWGAAYKLSGKACELLTVQQDSKFSVYPMGLPTPKAVIEGIYGYDPRYDSTYPGGFGDCRLGVRPTYRWINNPIIAGLNWALGMVENGHVVGGIGASSQGIDMPAFVEAANVSDANGWTVSAWPDTSEDVSQVLKQFLQAGGASYARHAGKISCVSRGAAKPSIVTVTGRDTCGPIELDTGASLYNRINTITPSFMSEAHGWKHVPADPVTFEALRTEDGGKRGDQITYRFADNARQAGQLAAYDILDAREPFSGTIPFKPHLRRLKRGDCFDLDEPGFLLDGVKCMVLGRSYNAQIGEVRVSFRSETDGKHPLALGKTTTMPDYPVLTPADPTLVSPPLPEDWVLIPKLPNETGVQVPIIDVVGEVSNSTATAVHFEWTLDVDGVPSPDWISAGIWPPTVTSISVPADPGTWIWIGASYLRGENFSNRQVYGPVQVPALVSDDTTHLNGEPVQDILDKLTDTATLTAQNALAVADLDGRVDDTITAAEAAIAAGEAANLAVLKAGEAGDAATASNISAGIATTKADESGNSATAANAAKLAAESARDGAASSAAAAVTSASTASTKTTEAGNSASAAEGAATTATTAAGNALTYRNQASSAKDDAISASISSGTSAQFALGGALATFPPVVAQEYWTLASSPGLPAERPDIGASTVSNGRYVGTALCGPKQRLQWLDQRVIEVSAEVHNPNTTPSQFAFAAFRFTEALTYLTWNTVGPIGTIGAGETVTYTIRFVMGSGVPGAANLARGDAVWVSLAVRNNLVSGNSPVQVGPIAVRDVTSEAASAGHAATALTQASNASASAASAGLSADLAASVGSGAVNPNPAFTNYPGTSVPAGWSNWNSANGTNERVEGVNGGYAIQSTYGGSGFFGVSQTSIPAAPEGMYAVLEVDVQRRSGTFVGASIEVQARNSSNSIVKSSGNINVRNTIGTPGTIGAVYQIRKLIDLRGSGITQYQIYLKTRGLTGETEPVVLRWEKALLRAATEQEIAAGTVLPDVESQLAITAAVAADAANRLASVVFSVTGGAGGDPFDVSLKAGPDGSDASITATKIRLRNLVNGQAVDALTVEGGKAKFSGELAVQSGASGERTVITTNAVRVFDAGNVERVTLGRW